MVKKIILSLIVFLVLIQFAVALDTEVKVKTIPYHDVIVSISSGGSVLDRLRATSDYFGDANFSFAPEALTFDVFVQVMNAGKTVYFQKYAEHQMGQPLLAELYPAGYPFPVLVDRIETTTTPENITNTTALAEENTTLSETPSNEAVNASTTATGSAIFGETGVLSKKNLYYLLGIIVVIVIIFVIVKLSRRKRNSSYYPGEDVRVRKMSDTVSESKSYGAGKDIEKAEKKLREAQEEINRLKHKDKIDEIRKRMAEDQKQIERLSKGY